MCGGKSSEMCGKGHCGGEMCASYGLNWTDETVDEDMTR